MGYLTDNMEPKNGLCPLFESQLELREPDMVFVPSLQMDDPKGFNSLLTELIDDIVKMASLIGRISKKKKLTYEEEIKGNFDMQEMCKEILQGVHQVSKFDNILLIIFPIIIMELTSHGGICLPPIINVLRQLSSLYILL